MKKTLPILLIAILTALVSGCKTTKGIKSLGTFKPDENGKRPTSVHWAYMDSNVRQSVIVVTEDGKAYIISEPSPDTAVQASLDLAGELKYLEEVDANLKLKYATEVAQLGKRTVATTVLRDALYKLSELRAAGNTITAEEKELFTTILATAERIALAELTEQQADLIREINEAYNEIPEADRTGLEVERFSRILGILDTE
jgi:hypothetical protein